MHEENIKILKMTKDLNIIESTIIRVEKKEISNEIIASNLK